MATGPMHVQAAGPSSPIAAQPELSWYQVDPDKVCSIADRLADQIEPHHHMTKKVSLDGSRGRDLGFGLVSLPTAVCIVATPSLEFRWRLANVFSTAAENALPVVPITISGTRSKLRPRSWFLSQGPIHVQIDEPFLIDKKSGRGAMHCGTNPVK